jgi:integrase/recombinase XerC
VPLNSTAREALTNYLQTLHRESTYVFPSRKQSTDAFSPIGERALIYIIGKYAERARVADVSPHDLRHRFGYQMARVVSLHRLAQIMGHDSLDTTLRYIRVTQQDLQQAVESIAWA